jgi:tetratricopeptide (TPR) repeat protein
LHKRAIALAEKHLGADHAVTNWSVYSLGKFYVFHLGQFVDAEPLFDRCIRSMRGRDSSEATYGFALVDRAGLHLMNGHDAEAERLFREAVDYLDKLYGVASSEHAIAVWAYAACLVRLGKADQAERIARRMADNCKASHGEKSFRTADSMVNLARVCVPQRKFAEAEKLLTGAARFFERGTSYEECKL